MSPAAKNGAMLAVVIVALAAAGFFMFRNTGGTSSRGIPRGGPKTQWICEKCSQHFELDAADYEDWYNSPDKRNRDPNLRPGFVAFWCPSCKEFTVVRANVKGGEWTYAFDSKGNPVKKDTPKKK